MPLDPSLSALVPSDCVAARITAEHRGAWTAAAPDGPVLARVPGAATDRPVVGDWVALDGDHVVRAVLPRRTALSRKQPGRATAEQVLVANVDTVWCVAALGGDVNLRRLERYVAVAWESGATPVVVLTKADRADTVADVASVAIGVAVVVTSVVTGAGLDDLRALVPPGTTAALLGPSGVGKSSLVDALTDVAVAVGDVRRDDKGRHTTTRRELVEVPGGGALVDTPGLRELGLWSDDHGGVDAAFADVAELASGCRFSDCAHEAEPGCAVRDAIDPSRLASYRKLERELAHLERRQDAAAARRHNEQWKAIHKAVRGRSRP